MDANGWEDERLKVMVLRAIALNAHGAKDKAVQLLGDALALAERTALSVSSWTKVCPWFNYWPKQFLMG